MRRSGFTLIELLIVVGLIVLLMGLLIPAVSIAKTQAQRAKTTSLIQTIAASCDIYRNLNGTYPDDPTISEILMGTGSPATGNAATVPTAAQWITIAGQLLYHLQTVDREHFSTMTALNDSWGNPLRYRPSQYYPYSQTPGTNITTGTPILIDSANPPHPDTFQLWSIGQNLKDEQGQSGTDDITNWPH